MVFLLRKLGAFLEHTHLIVLRLIPRAMRPLWKIGYHLLNVSVSNRRNYLACREHSSKIKLTKVRPSLKRKEKSKQTDHSPPEVRGLFSPISPEPGTASSTQY